jgi:hypothetical protein
MLSAQWEDNTLYGTPWPTLRWRYYNPGDYDQNGEVNQGDLVALVQHLGEKAEGGSMFAPHTIQSVVDGDGNGEINLADLTVMGQHYKQNALGGFRIYVGPSATDDPLLPEHTLAGSVSFASTVTNPRAERLLFELTLDQVEPELSTQSFYAQQLDDSGNVGNSYRFVVPHPPTRDGDLLWLSFDDRQGRLRFYWYYFNLGDGDQDGVVDSRVFKGMGEHWMEHRGVMWDYEVASMYDLDRNGEVNASDLQVLGLASIFGTCVSGYRLYHSATDSVPNGLAKSTLLPIASIPMPSIIPDPAYRFVFQYEFPSTPAPGYWWVRPYSPGGLEGAASWSVQIP